MNTQDCPPSAAHLPQSPSAPASFQLNSLLLDELEKRELFDTLRQMALNIERIESRLTRLEKSLSKWV